MTEPEIRRALAVCEERKRAATAPLNIRSDRDYEMADAALHSAAVNPVTGYAATLRALLEARELLSDGLAQWQSGPSTEWRDEVRAFLAEGE